MSSSLPVLTATSAHAPARTSVAVRRTVRRDAEITRMTRYRGGTYSPTVDTVMFTDGTTARTDLIRLNPDVGAYSLDFNGMVTDSPTVYRPHSWDEVTGAYAARFRSAAISALLAQSYPHVGLAELSSRLRAAGYPLNCGNLREHQAIAATQAAIWRLTNNLSLDTAPVDVPIGVTTITSDGGTVVDVGDVDAFAAALSGYVGSPDLRQTAGAVSRERGTVIYGADALVRQVARIYEEVLGR